MKKVKRLIALMLITCLVAGCGGQRTTSEINSSEDATMNDEVKNAQEATTPDVAEGEAFVPENPDAMPVDDGTAVTSTYKTLSDEMWYDYLLARGQLKLGNNKRLKNVIDRANNGEKITVATIGGSITEGAGATKYQECYAYQTYEKFKTEFCPDNQDNVLFVNAGVGGTPSVFGDMRYQRDVVENVAKEDSDGLPDVVIIEFAVNDYQEPTNHKCYESLVKEVLSAPNEPAVILLFAVFPSGFTLQNDLAPIGFRYDLMMVSISDAAMPAIGDGDKKRWTEKDFFYDIYHPTTLGHTVMSDTIICAMKAAVDKETKADDVDLTVEPVFGLDYMGIQTIYKRDALNNDAFTIGGFKSNDPNCYKNLPLGIMWEDSFMHDAADGNESMKFELECKNMLIAYRSVSDASYGDIEILMDGSVIKTIQGNTGSWGQSVSDVVFAEDTSKNHKFEIRMAAGSEDKKFTITCLSYTN